MPRTVLLTRCSLPYPSAAAHFVAEAWWTCHSTRRHTWRARNDCLLATGEALTVVPPTIRANLALVVTPVRGLLAAVPSWFGVPCRIGQSTVWLAVQETACHCGPFPILVLLPQRDLPGAPPFVFLGAQFLLEHQAQVFLDPANPGN